VSNQTGIQHADKELVEQTLGGNQQAFASIIRQTEALVASIVFKMINNAEDRKDIAQDIYLKAFHKLSGFKFESKLSTWIGQIAYNTCYSWLEKKKLVFPDNYENDASSFEDPLDMLSRRLTDLFSHKAELQVFEKQRAGIIKTAMEKLSPISKTLLTLFHQEEMSYAEIAAITGLPEGTLKSYLFRARKSLKDNLLLNYKKEEL
jgi:RNA polymerase sigma-70 factor (ECF subfamily)